MTRKSVTVRIMTSAILAEAFWFMFTALTEDCANYVKNISCEKSNMQLLVISHLFYTVLKKKLDRAKEAFQQGSEIFASCCVIYSSSGGEEHCGNQKA
jgi:hypothetical protein